MKQESKAKVNQDRSKYIEMEITQRTAGRSSWSKQLASVLFIRRLPLQQNGRA